MTTQYSTNFFYSLFRWRGSVWKSVWKELILWLLLYFAIRFALIYAIPEKRKESISKLIHLFDSYTQRLPLEFLLGFYVSQVVSRWWSQTMALSMPYDLMATVSMYIPGTDKESRRIRCTIARHIILSFVLAYRCVSSRLKKLFPNNDRFVEVGLLTSEENSVLQRAFEDTVFEIPLQWVQENFRVKSQRYSYLTLLKSLNGHRARFSSLAKFNAYPVPLVYTQTVTVAVYGYFIFCLIGHQFYRDSETNIVFPFLTILRFLFGIGWLKVAEYLAKPFGDDDEDINLCNTLQSYVRMMYTVAEFAPMNKPTNTVLSDDKIANSYSDSDYLKLSHQNIVDDQCAFNVYNFLDLFDPNYNGEENNKKTQFQNSVDKKLQPHL